MAEGDCIFTQFKMSMCASPMCKYTLSFPFAQSGGFLKDRGSIKKIKSKTLQTNVKFVVNSFLTSFIYLLGTLLMVKCEARRPVIDRQFPMIIRRSP